MIRRLHSAWPPRPVALAIVLAVTMVGAGSVVAASRPRLPSERRVAATNPFAGGDAREERALRAGVPARITFSAPATFRRAVTLRAQSTPARPGTRVHFQAQDASGRWSTVASGPQDAHGRAQAAWRPAGPGMFTIRSAVATDDDGPARYSPAANVLSLAPDARTIRWREWVEPGVGGSEDLVATVKRVLVDRRGWASRGEVGFRYTLAGPVDLWVRLATPRTTDRLCAPAETRGKWSCHNGGGIVINSARWFEGSPSLDIPVERYRALVVNHEVGHALGFAHRGCPGRGRPAPVMMQQSKGLAGCRANPWPLPEELARL